MSGKYRRKKEADRFKQDLQDYEQGLIDAEADRRCCLFDTWEPYFNDDDEDLETVLRGDESDYYDYYELLYEDLDSDYYEAGELSDDYYDEFISSYARSVESQNQILLDLHKHVCALDLPRHILLPILASFENHISSVMGSKKRRS